MVQSPPGSIPWANAWIVAETKDVPGSNTDLDRHVLGERDQDLVSLPKIQSDMRGLCLDQPYSSLPRAISLPVRFAPQLVKARSCYFEADQLPLGRVLRQNLILDNTVDFITSGFTLLV
jgi:hypothetical protein